MVQLVQRVAWLNIALYYAHCKWSLWGKACNLERFAMNGKAWVIVTDIYICIFFSQLYLYGRHGKKEGKRFASGNLDREREPYFVLPTWMLSRLPKKHRIWKNGIFVLLLQKSFPLLPYLYIIYFSLILGKSKYLIQFHVLKNVFYWFGKIECQRQEDRQRKRALSTG